MPKFNPLEPMSFDSPPRWPEWRERFARFRIATKLNKDDGEVQVASLVYAMGRQAENILKSFKFAPHCDVTELSAEPNQVDPRDDYNIVLGTFDEYFVPKINIIHERAQFYQRVQQPGESVEAFVRSLHELAAYCQFEDKECEHVRDRLISGMLDKDVSQKLQLEQDDLTLVKSPNQSQVNFVKKDASQRKQALSRCRQPVVRTDQRSQPGGKTCGQCGYMHRTPGPDACPAKGKQCNRCGKRGHFEKMCRLTKSTVVHEVVKQPDETYFCGAVNCDDTSPAWKVDLDLNDVKGQAIYFKLDSGADVSVMSKRSHNQPRPRPTLRKVNANISSPGGPLTCIGQFIAHATIRGTAYSFRVIVVQNDVENLLSRGAASKMRLISKLDTVTEGIGCIKTEPVKLRLKEEAQPYAVTVARRVPIPLLPKVREELDRLKATGVIEEITKPTQWCAPMVPVVKKNGKVRLCVDLKKLNVSVRRERFILPTLEDLTSKLSGATVFSSLDAASGFYQIPLDKDSRELTTFITLFGRYCFRCLPFGITSAPEIFMRKMTEILAGVEGVFTYMDDILVFGKDKKEHDDRLSTVLEVLRRAGLKLNAEKCHYGQSELKFLGHKFTKESVFTDRDKVTAILNMPQPTSVTQLRQILGMAHYLGAYLPDLHVTTRPLNDLLKGDVVWSWGPDQEGSEAAGVVDSSARILLC